MHAGADRPKPTQTNNVAASPEGHSRPYALSKKIDKLARILRTFKANMDAVRLLCVTQRSNSVLDILTVRSCSRMKSESIADRSDSSVYCANSWTAEACCCEALLGSKEHPTAAWQDTGTVIWEQYYYPVWAGSVRIAVASVSAPLTPCRIMDMLWTPPCQLCGDATDVQPTES